MAIEFVPCKACGKPQRSGRKNCMYCHANISTGEMPPDRSDQYQEHLLLNENKVRKVLKKPNPWIFALIGCFAVIVGITIVINLYNDAAKQNAVANDAIKALKKIRAATQVGVPFREYNRLTIEAKAEVDDTLSVLPDGELKKEISLAMDAYADASKVFNEKILNHGFALQWEPGKTLIPKYSIPARKSIYDGAKIYGKPYSDDNLYADIDDTLQTLWSLGRVRIKRASRLIKQGPSRKSHASKGEIDKITSVLQDFATAQRTLFASSNQYTRNMSELVNAGYLPNPNVRFVLLPTKSPDSYHLALRHVRSENVYMYNSKDPDVMGMVSHNDFHESFHKLPGIARSLD